MVISDLLQFVGKSLWNEGMMYMGKKWTLK
jgi:hypothetical protein